MARQLIVKSVSFDAYNVVGCKVRGQPFWGNNTFELGDHRLSIEESVTEDALNIRFESVCPYDMISFEPYNLSFDEYISKLSEAVETDSDFIVLEVPVRYSQNTRFEEDGCCRWCSNACGELKNNKPDTSYIAFSFNKDELVRVVGLPKTTRRKSMKAKKNLFGANFEFGKSKDINLASTLLGVAVKDPASGDWYKYDRVNNTRINLGRTKMGNLPIFLIPTTQMVPGDLIKRGNKYLWITEKTPSGTFKAVNALTGTVEEIIAEQSLIPGFAFYTKVVAMELNTLNDNSGNNVGNNLLSAMLLMQWMGDDSKSEFSIDSINEDDFNGMGAMLPLILAQQNGGLNNIFEGEGGQLNLPMLMMLGDGDNDMMQLVVMSQLLNGKNNGGTQQGFGFENIIPNLVPTNSDVTVAVVCDNCNATYPQGTNFCPKCGGQTHPVAEFCTKCGATLIEGAKFCHKCGAKVDPDNCPGCGAEITDKEAKFCHKCGTQLASQITAVQPNPVTQGESQMPNNES